MQFLKKIFGSMLAISCSVMLAFTSPAAVVMAAGAAGALSAVAAVVVADLFVKRRKEK